MAKEQTILTAPPQPQIEVLTPEAMGMRDTDIQLFKRAQMYARSTIIPKEYQGNESNCYIAMEMAHRLNLSPMFVMNNLYIVHGRPAWSSKGLIQLAKSTVLDDLTYVVDKADPNNWKCVAHARTKTGRDVEGMEISVDLAKKWGWWDKNPIWRNGTELMLRYRAAAWLINTEFPECAQGMLTKEEMDDIEPTSGRRIGAGSNGKTLDDVVAEGAQA